MTEEEDNQAIFRTKTNTKEHEQENCDGFYRALLSQLHKKVTGYDSDNSIDYEATCHEKERKLRLAHINEYRERG